MNFYKKFCIFLASLILTFGIGISFAGIGDEVVIGPIEIKSSDGTVTIGGDPEWGIFDLSASGAVINKDGTITVTPEENKKIISAWPLITRLSNSIYRVTNGQDYKKARVVDDLLTNDDLLWNIILDYTGYPVSREAKPPFELMNKLESRDGEGLLGATSTEMIVDDNGNRVVYPPAWTNTPRHAEVTNIVAFYPFKKWGKRFINAGTDYPNGNVTEFGRAQQFTGNSIPVTPESITWTNGQTYRITEFESNPLVGNNSIVEILHIPFDQFTHSGALCEGYSPVAGAKKFTIMAWIYRTDVGGVIDETEHLPANRAIAAFASRIVADLSGTTSGDGFQIRFGINSGDPKLDLFVNPSAITVDRDPQISHTGLTSLKPHGSHWHHVTITYDSTTTTAKSSCYIDGNSSGTVSFPSYFPNPGIVASNNTAFSICCSSGADTYRGQFMGYMDDVIIFRDWTPANSTEVKYWRDIDDSLVQYPSYESGTRFGQFDPQVEIYSAQQINNLLKEQNIPAPSDTSSATPFGQFDPREGILNIDDVNDLIEELRD